MRSKRRIRASDIYAIRTRRTEVLSPAGNQIHISHTPHHLCSPRVHNLQNFQQLVSYTARFYFKLFTFTSREPSKSKIMSRWYTPLVCMVRDWLYVERSFIHILEIRIRKLYDFHSLLCSFFRHWRGDKKFNFCERASAPVSEDLMRSLITQDQIR